MCDSITVSVQEKDFDVASEYQHLLVPNKTGAIVTFVGRVRDFSSNEPMVIQHYPGMTEHVLQHIVNEANNRWPMLACKVIHRVGALQVDDQIVFVGVSSAHRKDAFAANEYIIDILKTEAPFWKKEGATWVEAKNSDQKTADAWLTKSKKDASE